MPIKHWPACERPREKLLAHGPQSLSDAELLAIFLRTGCAGVSAVDLARQLLSRFDGLRGLLSAPHRQFCAERGLGDAKYSQLQATLEMARRHLGETLKRDTVFTNSDTVKHYLLAQLRDLPHEVFAALLLDSQHRLIRDITLSSGTIDGASVHPREVVKTVLAHNAAAVIFAHNHPSGVAEPSQADRHITDRLVSALGLVDVRVLDHLVVGDGAVTSFAERGWL